MDIWSLVAKHLFGLPTADWALAGRWFGHMSRGVFVHRSIAAAAPIPHELAVGWIGHYVTGVSYGLIYMLVVTFALGTMPTLLSALIFGLVTLIAPWLVMQPGMGAGVFASKLPNAGIVRFVNLSMHVVFGVSLYIGWVLVG